VPVQIIPEDPADEFDPDEWHEAFEAGGQKAGGAAVMSHARQENGYQILVPANKVRAATRRLLGYSVADTAAPYRLSRPETPFADPVFPWLWADGVTWAFLGPKGDPLREHPEYPSGTAYLPQQDRKNTGFPEATTRYQWAVGTVRFAQVGGSLGDGDDANDPEERRYLWLDKLQPSNQIVVAEGAGTDQFRWAEGPGDGLARPVPGSGAGADPALTSAATYTYKTTCGYTVVWKCVEQTYCCVGPDAMPFPRRLLAGLGKVNETPFLTDGTADGDKWHPSGTLLLDAIEGYRYQLPLNTTGATGLWAWDWRLTITWFDPTRGKTDPAGKRGHFLLPFRFDGRWYLATRGPAAGSPAGIKTVEEFDFAELFKHVLIPL
jgi:hypothetical protein